MGRSLPYKLRLSGLAQTVPSLCRHVWAPWFQSEPGTSKNDLDHVLGGFQWAEVALGSFSRWPALSLRTVVGTAFLSGWSHSECSPGSFHDAPFPCYSWVGVPLSSWTTPLWSAPRLLGTGVQSNGKWGHLLSVSGMGWVLTSNLPGVVKKGQKNKAIFLY